jgi:hypothetical protein
VERWVAGGVARPVRRWKVIAEVAQGGREVREELREAIPGNEQDAGHQLNMSGVGDPHGPSATLPATASRSCHH